jgi:septal ring-binding cell division protein DamX
VATIERDIVNSSDNEAGADADAPHGRKADGTPRKRPAQHWTKDPERVAEAVRKRTATRAANAAAKTMKAKPRATRAAARQPGATDSLLARVAREFDEQIAAAAVILADRAREAEEATLRAVDAQLEVDRLMVGREAVNVRPT